jgi:hypothetical protein
MEPATTTSTDAWEVIATHAHRGNPTEPGDETVLVHGAEDEARRVYADEVAVASDRGYLQVRLRTGGRDVDRWPPATGWTS